jgi:hypothetical protein
VISRDLIEIKERTTRRTSDAFVPWLIFLGGAVPLGIGWIVGVVLLWKSATWRLIDKIIGTFILPGGLFAYLYLRPTTIACSSSGTPGGETISHCASRGLVVSAPWNVPLVIVLFGAPILVFARLLWIDRRGYLNLHN